VPEGDTVHRTADRLDAALRDTVVERAELRWPSVPDVDLAGSRTLEVVARGKHLLHRFDTGATLHTHLRMEGQWRVEHPGERTERVLRRQDLRAAVLTGTWSAFGLRLGMPDLVPTAREEDLVGPLGPDIRRGVTDLDGKGDVVAGIVVMRQGENALDVIERVKTRREGIRPGPPPDIETLTPSTPATSIPRAIKPPNKPPF